jgi:hypothetical protein
MGRGARRASSTESGAPEAGRPGQVTREKISRATAETGTKVSGRHERARYR